jgi:hypothetical protein
MPFRVRLVFVSLSLAFFFVAAAPLYREFSRRSDIWWTPLTMLVPLADSGDRVEIYSRGKPLAALLRAGRLRIEGEGGSSTLATSDIGLRFNNWDRVRVERIPLMLVYAAACGISACLLVLVLSGRLAYGQRPHRGRRP